MRIFKETVNNKRKIVDKGKMIHSEHQIQTVVFVPKLKRTQIKQANENPPDICAFS